MRKLIVTLVTSLVFLAAARADNATAGANVTLHGEFFTHPEPLWGPGINAAPNALVNGVYQTNGHQWNYDSIWWNGTWNPANYIVVNLVGNFLISSLKIQADDNDTYKVEYWGNDSAWHDAWTVLPPWGWGLQTTGPVAASFETNAFRLTAVPGGVDTYYAISQFEAKGQRVVVDGRNVPEGGLTVALLSAALGLFGIARRFIRG